MAVRVGETDPKDQAADSSATSVGDGLPWHWGIASLWHQTMALQYQWLHEWCLGIVSGALQPARLTSAASGGALQRVARARHQLGCAGVADLESGAAGGNQARIPETAEAAAPAAAPVAVDGASSRRPRRATKAKSR